MMEDSGLEAAIQTYSAQLGQVEAALTACQDSSEQTELLKLREDLLQLIELTESSLVSIKKSQLLASLEGLPSSSAPAQTDPQQPGSLEQEFAAFYSELSESTAEPNPSSESEQDEPEEEEREPKSGTKVRAPYYTSWGTLEYHNAMVVCPEEPNGEEEQVRVLYLHPTHKSMKPCPYFLEDKCRFHDSCRFSHGQVVCVSELRDFLEADLTNMQQGSSCLAKHDDGIWYPAKILGIEGQFYTIKFDSLLLKEAVVEADGLIPPLRQDDSASSSDSDDDDLESGYAKVFSNNSEDQAAVVVNSAEFCGWEAHTRGIGSKLLMKMGYELGKGLGKTLSGRVEPVQAVVLPKGCSLDLCTELPKRKAKSLSTKTDATSCKRKKTKRRGHSTSARPNVFEFLNSKLGDQMDAGHSGSFRVQGVEAYQGDKSTKRSLNIQIFEKSERISQVKKEIHRLSSSLSQKNGRDVAVVKRMEEKLSASRKLLQQLESQMQSIQSAQKRADTHKKNDGVLI